MPVYTTHQAKTHLSALIRMAERGETITITRGQVPVALLVRIGAVPQPRRPGSLATTMHLDPALDFRGGPCRPNRAPDPERSEPAP
jgi:antitoxin (DNA-binding transcriptional repressor) of toxin-antitoxin stability system